MAKKETARPETPSDEELEAAITLQFLHWRLDIEMTVFGKLERVNPERANELRADFEEWFDAEATLLETKPMIKNILQELRRRLPNNRWQPFMKSVSAELFATEPGQPLLRLSSEREEECIENALKKIFKKDTQ